MFNIVTRHLHFRAILLAFLVTSFNVSANTEQLKQHANMFQTGYDLAQAGQLDQALATWKMLQKKTDLIPELKRALENNIAVILMKQQKYQEAKAVLDKALKADAQVATTIENLNKLYAYDAQKAYKQIFKDTKVTPPKGELLYFDVKQAKPPSANVITDINDADAVRIVQKATESWRQAWSNQDIESYLSFYDSNDFLPKNGVSYSAWKKSRYRSVLGPKFINITTANVKIVPLAEDFVRVNFYQTYQSDRFKDSIDKVLLWKRTDGQWKIVQEVVIYGKS